MRARELLSVLLAIAFLWAATVACKSKKGTDSRGPDETLPLDLEARARTICAKLEAAGVAKNCTDVNQNRGIRVFTVRFDVVGGDASVRATRGATEGLKVGGEIDVLYDVTYAAEIAPGGILNHATPDDYPRRVAFYKTWTSDHHGSFAVQWISQKWEECREAQKQSVDVCAKRLPKEYAAHKRLFEVAQGIADSTLKK